VPVRKRRIDRRAKIGQQIRQHHPRHHKRPVVRRSEQVIPFLGWEAELVLEKGERLSEWEPSRVNRHGAAL